MLKNYRTLVEMSNQITVVISLHQMKKKKFEKKSKSIQLQAKDFVC
jgi:hypothetical protein